MDDRYLFKAKHFNEWHIGNIVKEPDGLYIRDTKKNVMAYINDESTICQCTGLKEKNGNLIWENDVVKKHFYEDYDACVNLEEYIGIVKITDCAWVIETIRDKCIRPIFEAMSYSEDVKHFEVIGNIFDNPELLESEG